MRGGIDIWVPDVGMSPIEFIGILEFRDTTIPLPGKDDWGVDTLERTLQGPASRLDTFMASLKQGNIYEDGGGNKFFLQSWQPINHRVFPGAQLLYKGFINGVLPNPLPSTTQNEICSTLTADGLHITIGSEDDGTDRVIIGGTREIKYVSPTTVWRYLNKGEPTVAKYEGQPGNVRWKTVVNRGSTIFAQFEDGSSQRYVATAPAALATALFAEPFVEVTGPSFQPIIGTPYYECEEVCQLRYPDS